MLVRSGKKHPSSRVFDDCITFPSSIPVGIEELGVFKANTLKPVPLDRVSIVQLYERYG
jgi:hypothetical protein